MRPRKKRQRLEQMYYHRGGGGRWRSPVESVRRFDAYRLVVLRRHPLSPICKRDGRKTRERDSLLRFVSSRFRARRTMMYPAPIKLVVGRREG